MGEVEWPRTMAINVILLTLTLACFRARAEVPFDARRSLVFFLSANKDYM